MAAGGHNQHRQISPEPASMGPMTGTCESCGRTNEDITLVRRVYVTPEAWDTAERIDLGSEEHWCYVCRTHYPHQEID